MTIIYVMPAKSPSIIILEIGMQTNIILILIVNEMHFSCLILNTHLIILLGWLDAIHFYMDYGSVVC